MRVRLCNLFRFALRDRSDRSIRTRDDAQRRRRDDVGVRLHHRHERQQLNEEKERVEWETVLERVRVRQLHCISIKNRKTREQMMIEQQLSLSLSRRSFFCGGFCAKTTTTTTTKTRGGSFQWRQIFLSIKSIPFFSPNNYTEMKVYNIAK